MQRSLPKLGGALVVMTLGFAPVGYTPANGLQISEAACQSGTCCPETKSWCIIGDYARPDRYASLTGGSCGGDVIAPGG